MRKPAKKLSLNAETLRNLDRSSLKDVGGGTNLNTVCVNCTATNVCSGCRPCF